MAASSVTRQADACGVICGTVDVRDRAGGSGPALGPKVLSALGVPNSYINDKTQFTSKKEMAP